MFDNIKNKRVFEYFRELAAIPHGSGNMEAISGYCMEFAKKHSLEAFRDDLCNVIIYKNASPGYEDRDSIILQGHLDMVCQKDEGIEIDFEKDGLSLIREGDYIKAKGTTLGADNGIAVAMMLAILEDDSLKHPPIEAVFTTDEEIGMIGALGLDFSRLKGKRMINIDSEDAKTVTVSCAGGSDFTAKLQFERELSEGEGVRLCVKGLRGGHSGVEINSGRVNANILMGRILNHIKNITGFDIIGINGGDKGNAIPVSSTAELVVRDKAAFKKAVDEYCSIIENEIRDRESGFRLETEYKGNTKAQVMAADTADKLIYFLLCAPNGVCCMSCEIENLVETSLNLGIAETGEDYVRLLFTLRSNKKSALAFLEEKLCGFFAIADCEITTGGHYPPWEYRQNSRLVELYKEEYKNKFGSMPEVEAIHAGLECGVFAAGIEDFDCISIGPELHDIHTTKERLGITSTENIYEIIVELMGKL